MLILGIDDHGLNHKTHPYSRSGALETRVEKEREYPRRNFSSNQIVHQSSFGLCFWMPDLFISRF